MSVVEQISIVSGNLAREHGNPQERWDNFESICADLESTPDVIVAHEVAWLPGAVGLRSLAHRMGPDHNIFVSDVRKNDCQVGAAVITNRPVIGSYSLPLGGQFNRRAQIVVFGDEEKGADMVLANVHLSANPFVDPMKSWQLGLLSKHLRGYGETTPQIVAGDFNATPQFRSVKKMMRRGFESAHVQVHGKEPHHTYPTPLSRQEIIEGGYSKRWQHFMLSSIGRALPAHKRSRSGLIQYPIDFIFTRGNVVAVKAGLLYEDNNGCRPFSDHHGLVAQLEVPALAETQPMA